MITRLASVWQSRGCALATAGALLVTLTGTVWGQGPPTEDIHVNVYPGETREENVGAGFGLITKTGTQLNIYLSSSKGTIVKSEVESNAQAITWTKISETHFRAAGVCPNTPFWCIIRCTLAFDGGEGEPPKRWMSVSYVDIDADTENKSLLMHRSPSRSQEEDHWEYPGAKGADVIGLIVPVNDNNHVTWEVRDGTPPMDRTKDPDVLDVKLEVHPRKAGEWSVSSHYPGILLYAHDGTPTWQADRALSKDADVTLDVHVESRWYVTSGYRFSVRGEFFPNQTSAGFAADEFKSIFLGCDIDVDANNDGSIDNYNDFNNGADFLEAHPSGHNKYSVYPQFRLGMIVGVNDDDDDGDGHADNGWNGTDWTGDNADSIQGASDRLDMRPGVLRGLGVPDGGPGSVKSLLDHWHPTVVLRKLHGDGAIRLFTESGDHIGPFINEGDYTTTVGTTDLWDLLHRNDVDILVEGLRPGEVMLAYELWVNNIFIHRDVVRITVAPWMPTSHRDEVSAVYVATHMEKTIRDKLAKACGVLPVIPVGGSDYWIQDQMEVGFRSWHHTGSGPSNARWHTAIVNSPRTGDGLDGGVAHLRAPNVSVIRPVPPAGPNTYNSFGNVEAFPPHNGSLGQVYYGTYPQQALVDFFDRQAQMGPQAESVRLGSTNWLVVGHIDEVTSVQMTGPDSFRVILASPRMGIQILEDNPDHVLEAHWLFDSGLGPMTAREALDEAFGTTTWRKLNDSWQTNINAIKSALNGMGIATVEVPVYFAPSSHPHPDWYGKAVSLLPNTVNMLNVNGTLITLDPMCPHFRSATVSVLGSITFIEGLPIHYGYGGLHCATNAQREPRDDLKRWWEHN